MNLTCQVVGFTQLIPKQYALYFVNFQMKVERPSKGKLQHRHVTEEDAERFPGGSCKSDAERPPWPRAARRLGSRRTPPRPRSARTAPAARGGVAAVAWRR